MNCGIISAARRRTPTVFDPVRATSILHVNNASSKVVPFPTGAAAGDTVLIFCGHGFSVTTPSGWGSFEDLTGANFNGKIVRKVLNSGDITTGSVTISFAGAFYGVVWAVCLVGTNTVPASAGAFEGYRNSGGAATRSLTSTFTASGGECVLLFGAGRLSNLSVTCNVGTLQDTLNASLNAGGAGYKLLNVPAGHVSATFSYSGTPTGDYGAMMIIGP